VPEKIDDVFRSAFVEKDLLAVYKVGDPIYFELKKSGWLEVPLDPYFTSAGASPVGYALMASPGFVAVGYAPALDLALGKVPDVEWQKWAEEISQGP
jgi:hypothetical protein